MSAATDQERYPTLTDGGRAMLRRMVEHPSAPRFRNRSGNRLLAHEVEALREFEAGVLAAGPEAIGAAAPAWLDAFVAGVFARVPHYRAQPRRPRFEDIPTVDRGDLAGDIARFVPDDVALDRLIQFRTSGTTGHPLLIASHPVVAGRYLAFHKRALRRAGVELRHGAGQVGVVLLGHQRRCFTYVSVTPAMGESGLAKINLHPGDWRHPDDRGRYLDAMAPEVIAGDPISFAELLGLDFGHRPRALMSVSMALSPALRERLEARFGCPVLDIYSMNEAGPVACFVAGLGGHLLLQPRLYVEVLDDAGRPVAAGDRGEITLSGGFNFCLPLLRYRTGDHGALLRTPEGVVITGLEGRRPVRFRTAAGARVNNVDVTHALADVPLSRFTCHQAADCAIHIGLADGELHWGDAVAARLQALLGELPVAVAPLAAGDKVLQYSSDVPDTPA
ncbi:AMP-binding protein [Luteimonas sp. A537]